jgi:acyl-CoA dehydrogenase
MSESMIEQSTARLFAGAADRALLLAFEAGRQPAALWQLVADQGLPLALATESAGGIQASWREAYPILRGLGYWQVPLPLAETMIAALLLSAAGIEVPDGAIALVESVPGDADGTLHPGGDAAHPTLTGRVQRVPWASACRWALVSLVSPVDGGGQSAASAVGGQIALIDLHDTATATLTTGQNPAGEPVCEVALRNAPCLALAANPLPGLDRPVRTLGAIARSVMMVGAMEYLLEQSVQYASDRVQFGRPIGKNQAIQQQLALLAGEVAAARVAAIVACDDAPSLGAAASPATVFSAAVAKIRGGEAATRATSIAHQVHGAIGFTQEHGLNFATRRLWAWREAYGADTWWAGRLGAAAIQAGAAGFWPGVTARQFDGLTG